VSVDARQEQHVLFDDVDTRGITLLASSSTDPLTLSAWNGPKVLFNMEHPGIEFMDLVLPTVFPQLGAMCVHGTVGNMASLLAYQMGCTSIISMGMDLCYGAAGEGRWKYRCQDFEWAKDDMGSWSWRQRELKILYDNDARVKDTFEVEAGGKKFMVDPELDMYRKALYELVGSFKGTRFVDTAQDGVLRAMGLEYMDADKALYEICSRHIGPGESVALHLPEILQRRD